jgi:hypothetical protein
MAQVTTTRRFYIDHADNQPVVRTVPVLRPVRPVSESPATHQVPAASALEPSIAARARKAPKAVTKMVKSARKHARHP